MDDADLTSNNDEPDNDEHGVIADTFEDVNFVIDFSGTEHVEDLEEHKEIEDNGQVS